MHIPKVFERLCHFEIDLVTKFVEKVEEQYALDLQDIDKRARREGRAKFDKPLEYDEYLEFLAGEAQTLEQIRQLASHLAIVALYRIVELQTRKALSWRYDKKTVDKLRSAPAVQKRLMKDTVFLDRLPGKDNVDELRALNNAIKHAAKVTSELAKFAGWKEGDELRNLNKNFRRSTKILPTYVREMARIVVPVHLHSGR